MQVDALIIGGMWGRKDRSGMLGEYVLGLADGRAEHSMSPFLSFCRCVGLKTATVNHDHHDHLFYDL